MPSLGVPTLFGKMTYCFIRDGALAIKNEIASPVTVKLSGGSTNITAELPTFHRCLLAHFC